MNIYLSNNATIWSEFVHKRFGLKKNIWLWFQKYINNKYKTSFGCSVFVVYPLSRLK